MLLTESIKKRPGMYFGEDSKAGNAVVFELFANSVDQCLAGKASEISISVTGHHIVVADNGEGMPFGEHSVDNSYHSAVECYLMKLTDSPTVDGHAPHVHVSLGGLGLAVINACSKSLEITSISNGIKWQQRFGQGQILDKANQLFTDLSSGTTIELTLDADIFIQDCFEFSLLRKEIFEICHLFPHIKVNLDIEGNKETISPLNGLLDLAILYGYVDSDKQFSFHQTVDDIEIHVACIASSCHEAEQTTFYSWANGMRTNQGGTHVVGFRNALNKYNLTPNTAMISLLFHNPRYAGPSKGELTNEEVTSVIEKVLAQPLYDWSESEDLYL